MLRTLTALAAVTAAAVSLAGSALADTPYHPAPTPPVLTALPDTIWSPLPSYHIGLSWSPSTFDPSVPSVYRRYHVRVDATPPAPYAPSTEISVISGLLTSWQVPVQTGGHYIVMVRASQCFYEYGMCVWRQSDWRSEHFDVALAPVVPPSKG